MPQFEALGVQVLGMSIDHKFAEKAYAEKLQLNFPLLADPNREVSSQLGTLLPEVAGVKNVNMRAVLVIDSGMTLRWRFGESAALQPNVGEVLEQVKSIL